MSEETNVGVETPAKKKVTKKSKPKAEVASKPTKKVAKKDLPKVETKGSEPRVGKLDILALVKELGGKSVPTSQVIAVAEKKGIAAQKVLHHICQMRKMEIPLVTATKKGGKGIDAEEVSITKSGTAALKA